MVKILEYLYKEKSEHIGMTQSRISEFKSFEDYLYMMYAERTGLPEFYKLLSRSCDADKEEVLAKIYVPEEDAVYRIFAKVL
ncbi:hypothetical protein NUG13_11960 [Bacillus subtilis]|uniref:Uncharacterized protein n=1 Tax=Bacillus phage vB_BsuS_PJN02 TaxID=2920374 RepID=A0AC61TRZ4_9CAUD|nr:MULTISPECIES: hypothetical protein [Bacillus subtilis group]YP_010681735.1 hypothetical protein PQE76_gp117 [Bacillus phage vB_BsuS_PJN02]MCR4362043.1 hypothetical protein [Bacillus subtilis]UNH58460.1 hypothetical protein [Bacillus phage vB_BsuS_PJN02]UQB84341.1 hypothetical protein KMZ31_19670 [Bacillus amyloliquefaciens]WOF32978.1 hypothetical protein OEJ84_22910 [Bacillus subtilis]